MCARSSDTRDRAPAFCDRVFGDSLVCEPRLEHGVHALGRLLLYPMRDPGQVAQGELTHVFLGTQGRGLGEGAVLLSPDHEGPRLDLRIAERALAARPTPPQ